MNRKTISFSILSGKGGVGKSNLALNICYALHQLGRKVLLIDCDMGLANMDVLLGIAPEKHVQDILISNQNPADILVPFGPSSSKGSLDLLPANSGMAEFAELDDGARGMLRDKLNPLASNYDFVCMDIGAGISPTVLGFSSMTTLRLVVVTPEPTSLTDSYALIKVLSARHNVQDFYIIVNQVESQSETKKTYSRLSAVCKRFLGFAPEFLCEVRSDRGLIEAVRKQRPLMEIAPRSPAALDCMTAAEKLEHLRKDLLIVGEIDAPLRSVAVHN
ncbi:MAG: MinD/ParA family protein [Desulfovibrio sp.]|jgi:flagellar biosynthesis protein FlhG|nr:MinD/ParA family protein [Desulfovibrio sp.]